MFGYNLVTQKVQIILSLDEFHVGNVDLELLG